MKRTIQFYRDVIGLKEITKHAPSIGFEFGPNNLWIDRVNGISQAEIWLGCGTGGQTMVLAKHTSGHITGIDLFADFMFSM
jgi:hypothetical protein